MKYIKLIRVPNTGSCFHFLSLDIGSLTKARLKKYQVHKITNSCKKNVTNFLTKEFCEIYKYIYQLHFVK